MDLAEDAAGDAASAMEEAIPLPPHLVELARQLAEGLAKLAQEAANPQSQAAPPTPDATTTDAAPDTLSSSHDEKGPEPNAEVATSADDVPVPDNDGTLSIVKSSNSTTAVRFGGKRFIFTNHDIDDARLNGCAADILETKDSVRVSNKDGKLAVPSRDASDTSSPLVPQPGPNTLKRRLNQMEEPPDLPARQLGCSVESQVTYDSNTSHAVIDPLVKYEHGTNGQYCGSRDEQKAGSPLDQISDFMGCVVSKTEWKASLRLAKKLNRANVPAVVQQKELLKAASKEDEMYAPFEYLANYAANAINNELEATSHSNPSSEDDGHYAIVPAHSKELIGVDTGRKPDFVLVKLRENQATLEFIYAHMVKGVVELKWNKATEARPPTLQDPNSKTSLPTTYKHAAPRNGPSVLNPREQTLDTASLCLGAQSPHRRSILAVLITHLRIQVKYVDFGGSILSAEYNYADDFDTFFAVIIAMIRANASSSVHSGVEKALKLLRNTEEFSGVPSSAFVCSEELVSTGAIKAYGRLVTPFQVKVQLCERPDTSIAVAAFGSNLVARPAPVLESDLPKLLAEVAAVKVLERDRRAKLEGMQVTNAMENPNAKSIGALPRQMVPRIVFGPGTSRFACVTDNGQKVLTLQLAWARRNRPSEAAILRYANELGIIGVPPLVGSYDIAEMDSGVRAKLRKIFKHCATTRDVNMVLRAQVWDGKYAPLIHVPNMIDFLSGFGCILRVSVIGDLYGAGILHTNISPANMMVDASNPSKGVLVGFDMAELRGELASPSSQSPKPHKLKKPSPKPSNTSDVELVAPVHTPSKAIPRLDYKGPFAPLRQEFLLSDKPAHHAAFLARNRCTDTPPVHKLEDELESAYFSFLWMLGNTRAGWRIGVTLTDSWFSGGWDAIKRNKKTIIDDEADDDKESSYARPFAEALGVDPTPLAACIRAWAKRLYDKRTLDVEFMLTTLATAREAYITPASSTSTS